MISYLKKKIKSFSSMYLPFLKNKNIMDVKKTCIKIVLQTSTWVSCPNAKPEAVTVLQKKVLQSSRLTFSLKSASGHSGGQQC